MNLFTCPHCQESEKKNVKMRSVSQLFPTKQKPKHKSWWCGFHEACSFDQVTCVYCIISGLLFHL